jgi:formiminotetrahydrofolate cyclodeaminase
MTDALTDRRVSDLLEQLAAKTPTPGGGAVASVAAALGAALGNMVLAYSVGRKSLAEHEDRLHDAARRLGRARTLLLQLAVEDEGAYGLVNELSRLPGEDPRRAELPCATLAASQVPLSCMATCMTVLGVLDELPGITNRNMRSDLAIAAIMAEAGARAAAWNVLVNLPGIQDEPTRQDLAEQCDSLLENAVATARRIERACRA